MSLKSLFDLRTFFNPDIFERTAPSIQVVPVQSSLEEAKESFPIGTIAVWPKGTYFKGADADWHFIDEVPHPWIQKGQKVIMLPGQEHTHKPENLAAIEKHKHKFNHLWNNGKGPTKAGIKADHDKWAALATQKGKPPAAFPTAEFDAAPETWEGVPEPKAKLAPEEPTAAKEIPKEVPKPEPTAVEVPKEAPKSEPKPEPIPEPVAAPKEAPKPAPVPEPEPIPVPEPVVAPKEEPVAVPAPPKLVEPPVPVQAPKAKYTPDDLYAHVTNILAFDKATSQHGIQQLDDASKKMLVAKYGADWVQQFAKVAGQKAFGDVFDDLVANGHAPLGNGLADVKFWMDLHDIKDTGEWKKQKTGSTWQQVTPVGKYFTKLYGTEWFGDAEKLYGPHYEAPSSDNVFKKLALSSYGTTNPYLLSADQKKELEDTFGPDWYETYKQDLKKKIPASPSEAHKALASVLGVSPEAVSALWFTHNPDIVSGMGGTTVAFATLQSFGFTNDKGLPNNMGDTLSKLFGGVEAGKAMEAVHWMASNYQSKLSAGAVEALLGGLSCQGLLYSPNKHGFVLNMWQQIPNLGYASVALVQMYADDNSTISTAAMDMLAEKHASPKSVKAGIPTALADSLWGTHTGKTAFSFMQNGYLKLAADVTDTGSFGFAEILKEQVTDGLLRADKDGSLTDNGGFAPQEWPEFVYNLMGGEPVGWKPLLGVPSQYTDANKQLVMKLLGPDALQDYQTGLAGPTLHSKLAKVGIKYNAGVGLAYLLDYASKHGAGYTHVFGKDLDAYDVQVPSVSDAYKGLDKDNIQSSMALSITNLIATGVAKYDPAKNDFVFEPDSSKWSANDPSKYSTTCSTMLQGLAQAGIDSVTAPKALQKMLDLSHGPSWHHALDAEIGKLSKATAKAAQNGDKSFKASYPPSTIDTSSVHAFPGNAALPKDLHVWGIVLAKKVVPAVLGPQASSLPSTMISALKNKPEVIGGLAHTFGDDWFHVYSDAYLLHKINKDTEKVQGGIDSKIAHVAATNGKWMQSIFGSGWQEAYKKLAAGAIPGSVKAVSVTGWDGQDAMAAPEAVGSVPVSAAVPAAIVPLDKPVGKDSEASFKFNLDIEAGGNFEKALAISFAKNGDHWKHLYGPDYQHHLKQHFQKMVAAEKSAALPQAAAASKKGILAAVVDSVQAAFDKYYKGEPKSVAADPKKWAGALSQEMYKAHGSGWLELYKKAEEAGLIDLDPDSPSFHAANAQQSPPKETKKMHELVDYMDSLLSSGYGSKQFTHNHSHPSDWNPAATWPVALAKKFGPDWKDLYKKAEAAGIATHPTDKYVDSTSFQGPNYKQTSGGTTVATPTADTQKMHDLVDFMDNLLGGKALSVHTNSDKLNPSEWVPQSLWAKQIAQKFGPDWKDLYKKAEAGGIAVPSIHGNTTTFKMPDAKAQVAAGAEDPDAELHKIAKYFEDNFDVGQFSWPGQWNVNGAPGPQVTKDLGPGWQEKFKQASYKGIVPTYDEYNSSTSFLGPNYNKQGATDQSSQKMHDLVDFLDSLIKGTTNKTDAYNNPADWGADSQWGGKIAQKFGPDWKQIYKSAEAAGVAYPKPQEQPKNSYKGPGYGAKAQPHQAPVDPDAQLHKLVKGVHAVISKHMSVNSAVNPGDWPVSANYDPIIAATNKQFGPGWQDLYKQAVQKGIASVQNGNPLGPNYKDPDLTPTPKASKAAAAAPKPVSPDAKLHHLVDFIEKSAKTHGEDLLDYLNPVQWKVKTKPIYKDAEAKFGPQWQDLYTQAIAKGIAYAGSHSKTLQGLAFDSVQAASAEHAGQAAGPVVYPPLSAKQALVKDIDEKLALFPGLSVDSIKKKLPDFAKEMADKHNTHWLSNYKKHKEAGITLPQPISAPVSQPPQTVPAVPAAAVAKGEAGGLFAGHLFPALSSMTSGGSAEHLGGIKAKEIKVAHDGSKYLYKPVANNEKERAYAGQIVAAVSALIVPEGEFVPVKVVKDGTKLGTLQPLLSNVKTMEEKDMGKLTPEQIKQLQRERVLDWVLSSSDSHAGNMIKTVGGSIIGVDKEQAFKFLGSDTLDTEYTPNEFPPVYNGLYSKYAAKQLDLDPNDLLPYIEKIESVSDEQWRDAVSPYVDARFASVAEREEFMGQILARKHAVRGDFEGFVTKLKKQRGELKAGQTFKFAKKISTVPFIDDLQHVKPLNVGGKGEVHAFKDSADNEWVWHEAVEASTGAAKPHKAYAAEGFNKLASKVSKAHTPIGVTVYGGKVGVISQPAKDAQTLEGVLPEALSESEQIGVATEHVMDWLGSQQGSHGGTLVKKNGTVVGTHKGEGFTFFEFGAGDKLSTSYKPPNATHPPYYNQFWESWKEGKIGFDPTKLEPVVSKIESIPDGVYRNWYAPYAKSLYGTSPEKQKKFLDAVVARKKNLRKDFESFLTELHKEKHGAEGYFSLHGGWHQTGGSTKKTAEPPKYKTTKVTAAMGLQLDEYGGSIQQKPYKDPSGNTTPQDASKYMTLKLSASSPKENLEKYIADFKLPKKPGVDVITGPVNHVAVVEKVGFDNNYVEKKELISTAAAIGHVPSHVATPPGMAHLATLPAALPNFEYLDSIHEAQLGGSGMHLYMDGDVLESQSLRVTKHLDPKGKEYYVLTGKVTAQAVPTFSGGTSSKYQPALSVYDPVKDAYVPSGLTQGGTGQQLVPSGLPYVADITTKKWTGANGSEMHLATGSPGFGLSNTLYAKVVPAQGETPAQAFQKLLQTTVPAVAPKLLKNPTPEDMERLKLARLLWAVAPQKSDQLHASKQVSTDVLLAELQKQGYGPDEIAKVTTKTVGPGYVTHVIPGRYQKLGVDKSRPRFLFNGISDTAAALSVLQKGLLSINERLAHGVEAVGGSVKADLGTGASDNALTRLATDHQLGNDLNDFSFHGAYGVIISPEELDRLDVYAFTGDNFGCCNPAEKSHGSAWTSRSSVETVAKEVAQNGYNGNEFCFRKGIANNRFLRLCAHSESGRKELIKQAKMAGLTEINGLPIEDFVVTAMDMKTIYNQYVKPYGY